MAERVSPLAGLPFSTDAGAEVTLRPLSLDAILQVAAWPETDSTVKAVIGELLGLDAPPVGGSASNAEAMVAALAPGRYLIVGRSAELVARFEAALPTRDATVTDLSHGRVAFQLAGRACEALLARVVAIDVGESAFPVSRVAQTSAHRIDIVLRRLAPEAFEIWCFRSFAESLAEWLLDAGAEIGAAFIR